MKKSTTLILKFHFFKIKYQNINKLMLDYCISMNSIKKKQSPEKGDITGDISVSTAPDT